VAALDALPLTANGKVDRKALMDMAATAVRAEPERRSEPPRTELERGLAKLWAELLRIETVGRHDNFFDLGGDSLTAIQMVARAARVGIDLSLRQLFRHQTVAELAADVEGRPTGLRGEPGWVTGPVPMTPGQVWFFDRIAGHLEAPHQFSNARLVGLREPAPARHLIAAAAWMLFHHDALRLRVSRLDGAWKQHNAGHEALDDAIHEVDLSALPVERQEAAIRGIVLQLLARRDLEGPLARFVVLRPDRLLYVLHHLVSDAASLSLLREDLETALGQLVSGEAVRLPAKTTSFRAWALRQSELARSDELRGQVDFWLGLARRGGGPLPADFPGGEAGTGEVDEVLSNLGEEETRRLLQARRFTDVLLAAVARAFHRWTGSRSVLLRQSLHGRDPVFEDVDLSRTLGWISTTAPVLLELSGSETPSEALASIAEQGERVPLRGLGYGVLRYMTGDPEVESRMASVVEAPAATFNFVGRFEGEPAGAGLLRDLPLEGTPVKLVSRRDPQLRIGAFVARGPRLSLTWQYGRDFYRRETIERLAEICLDELRTLTGYPPSASR
jgi:non-ribosomal peptide synthase protein (TIGR01720 family)